MSNDDLSVFGFHDGHACGWYRILLPLGQMEANGMRVQTHCGWNEEARDYRVIVGQRISRYEALPIWRRLSLNHRLVYETDDDVWSIDETNFAAKFAHTPDVIEATELAIQYAHLVTVSTEHLAKVVRKFNPNVVVLENRIQAALLDVERPRNDRLTVGWAGGDSHLRDIAMVAPQLRRFFERNPTVDFHTIGTDYRTALKLPGRHTPWNRDIWEYYRTIDFDIGLAPLIDSTFNRSKSAIKALEYAALGIPVVASDVEPYRNFVIDGETGFLVSNDWDWGRRLHQLTNDAAMREQMGQKAKESAARWTIEEGYESWVRAYQLVC